MAFVAALLTEGGAAHACVRSPEDPVEGSNVLLTGIGGAPCPMKP